MRKTMLTVRYGIPAGLELVGLAILAIDRTSTGLEAWAMLTGAGGAVLLLNGLYRIGAQGDADRDEEESAREYYDAHGDWPTATRTGGRTWSLPAGVVTLEAEEEEAAARARAEAAGREDAPPG
ncbi:MAG TPA: hypothetical protein VFR49_02200 [Solirubrobacteraceae bacterium]|nr:hypothetical protein [Solirubrobacteraceae bacterium]